MTLDKLLRVLRRRAGLILATAILTAAGALGFSMLQDEEYSASASLLLRPLSLDEGLGSPSAAPDPEREAATNIELASQDIIATRTASRLQRAGDADAAAAVQDVEVSAKGSSDLIEVKAVAPHPRTAARVANAFARQYVTFRRESDRARIRQGERALRRELARLVARRNQAGSTQRRRAITRSIRSLEGRLGDLSLLESLQTGNAVVVNGATPPSSPSSPKPERNTVIGGFVGLLLGLGLALVREQLDRRLRDSKELEEALGLPILVRLPESNAFGKRSALVKDLPPSEAEAFRMLRANLRHLGSGRKIDSVLITSASIEDGKSTVAFHLASAAASTGLDVLLIEADVRRPTLARLLGLPPDEGLTSVLTGSTARLADVSHELLLPRDRDGHGLPPTLDVVPAGQIPSDASELIDSERMQEIIRESRRNYSLVVIDTPPVGLVSDAIPLMSEVSAVVIVGRIGKITSEEAGRLREQLEKIDAPSFGIVANFTARDDGGRRPAGYELAGSSR
jgi:polysaccharide biosynthesis transport protein